MHRSFRTSFAALALSLVGAAAGCQRRATEAADGGGLPSASAPPPRASASASASHPSQASICATKPDLCKAPSGLSGRFLPHDEAASAASAASTAASAAPSARKSIGTFSDWKKAYEGSSGYEDKNPPRLGVLSDLPSLPRSTLVYHRSGRLVRVDLPAGKETVLGEGAYADQQARWTRDGQWLYFLSNREGGIYRAFRMRADGTEAAPVSGPLRLGLFFSWTVSDDGAMLAYVPDSSDQRELHLVQVATGRDEVLVRGLQLEDPSFSRDGKTLFLVQGYYMPPGIAGVSPDEVKRISAVDLATHAVRSLPNAGYAELNDPIDLGDGRLLFVGSADFSYASRAPHPLVMPKEGGPWKPLGRFAAPAGSLSLVPSPDGKRYAARWATRMGGFGADFHGDITLLGSDGSELHRLTPGFPRPFYGATSPSWAPDSRHLAFELTLCPYLGCEMQQDSVVLVDGSDKKSKVVFVGYGTAPRFKPGGA